LRLPRKGHSHYPATHNKMQDNANGPLLEWPGRAPSHLRSRLVIGLFRDTISFPDCASLGGEQNLLEYWHHCAQRIRFLDTASN
jgi:hypothetical protein